MVAPGGEREEQVVVFELGTQSYGIAVQHVVEIVRPPTVTPVPRAPACVAGVAGVRGRVIAVMDLHTRFGLPDGGGRRAARAIVIEIGGATICVVVDAVSGMVRIAEAVIDRSGDAMAAGETAYLRGIARIDGRAVRLVEPARLIDVEGARRAA
jgi:purine-binding chemotaxis protein CheW